ncbi:MAG: enoyl-CoA hydratase [Halopseudomonas sp.]
MRRTLAPKLAGQFYFGTLHPIRGHPEPSPGKKESFMSELVSYQFSDGIARLTLSNGKVNAVSPAVVEAFNKALDQAEQDKAVVVITGQPGILSGGYDLKVMTSSVEAAKDLVAAGSTLARRMLSHPFPVIVACSGHAVAKGAFILLSADYRIGIEGPFKIGLNEVAIGMTMHHVGIELARARLTNSAFNRSVINAEMFDPNEAVIAGFLDKVVPAEELENKAMEMAAQLTKLNMTAHRNTKLKTRKALLELLDSSITIDKQHAL